MVFVAEGFPPPSSSSRPRIAQRQRRPRSHAWPSLCRPNHFPSFALASSSRNLKLTSLSMYDAVEECLFNSTSIILSRGRSSPLQLPGKPANRCMAANGWLQTNLCVVHLRQVVCATTQLRTSGWTRVRLLWSTHRTPITAPTGSRGASSRLMHP